MITLSKHWWPKFSMCSNWPLKMKIRLRWAFTACKFWQMPLASNILSKFLAPSFASSCKPTFLSVTKSGSADMFKRLSSSTFGTRKRIQLSALKTSSFSFWENSKKIQKLPMWSSLSQPNFTPQRTKLLRIWKITSECCKQLTLTLDCSVWPTFSRFWSNLSRTKSGKFSWGKTSSNMSIRWFHNWNSAKWLTKTKRLGFCVPKWLRRSVYATLS